MKKVLNMAWKEHDIDKRDKEIFRNRPIYLYKPHDISDNNNKVDIKHDKLIDDKANVPKTNINVY